MTRATFGDVEVRVFAGSESSQLTPYGHDLDSNALYWEPLDYEGDVAFSKPCGSVGEIETAVLLWLEREML